MKTIRQVKTVFIIFIAFVCCWSPYIFVLLYDSSNSLPLFVHLYTSMLAHLHASLNFAIYNLSNRTVRIGYRRLFERLLACCCRQLTPSIASTAVSSSRDTLRTNVERSTCSNRNRISLMPLTRTVDSSRLQEIQSCRIWNGVAVVWSHVTPSCHEVWIYHPCTKWSKKWEHVSFLDHSGRRMLMFLAVFVCRCVWAVTFKVSNNLT